MTDARFLYITASSKEEALKIGRALVEERLVACANVIDGVSSLYWWEGKVQEDSEAVLIAKTQEKLVEAVIEKVKSLHSYSCPCVIALPIESGHEPYLQWLAAETRDEP